MYDDSHLAVLFYVPEPTGSILTCFMSSLWVCIPAPKSEIASPPPPPHNVTFGNILDPGGKSVESEALLPNVKI